MNAQTYARSGAPAATSRAVTVSACCGGTTFHASHNSRLCGTNSHGASMAHTNDPTRNARCFVSMPAPHTTMPALSTEDL